MGTPPKYESYLVTARPIKKFARTMIPDSGIDWKVERALRCSDTEPVNFAGKYTLLETGCGTGCSEYCLVDRTNGKVYPGSDFTEDFPDGYHGPTGFQYRRDSTLLVVFHAVGFDYPVHVSYYVWEGTNLKFLDTEDVPNPQKD
jgi:hypothetical protein